MPPKAEKSKKKRGLEPIELVARGILAALGVAALVLAAVENHEAIGTAFVGAAIAFTLGAAFFDRLLEVSTQGVKLADLRELEVAVEQEVPEASPEEREALVAEGSEILAVRRLAGEEVTPSLALREASLGWQRNSLAVEMRFAHWLVEQGWNVQQGERLVAATEPDLIAEKDGQRIAVEVKVGRRPIGIHAVRQALANATTVEAISSHREQASVQPVLVLGEVPLTEAAADLAATSEVIVFLLDAENQFTHLIGPELS